MTTPPEWEYTPDENGLYPAALGTENRDMDKYWIRDNYFIYKAIGDPEIPEAFREIVQKYGEKLRKATEKHQKGEIKSSSDHLHPRFDEDLEEIEGEWADFQIDSYANLLEVLSEEGHEEEAREVYRYLRGINPLETPCFDLWEHNHGVHSYTLATVAKAYRSFSENVENIPEEDIELYEQKLRGMMPEQNLSNLLILYIEPEFVDEELENKVLQETQKLTGKHGVERWKGDDWSGIDWTADTEPEWNMGHLLRYLVNDETELFERQKEIKQEHSAMPESMVRYGDGEYRPNVNTPLLWTEALYSEAEQKYRGEKALEPEAFERNGSGYSLAITGLPGNTGVDLSDHSQASLQELPDELKLSQSELEQELDVTVDRTREVSLESISLET